MDGFGLFLTFDFELFSRVPTRTSGAYYDGMSRSSAPKRKAYQAVLALVAALTLSGCGLTLDTLETGAPVTPVPVEPVAVSRGTIVSVVTFNAQATTGPEYVLATGKRATVRSAMEAAPGKAVASNSVIGWLDGQELRTPTDAVVVEWLEDGATVNQGVPVVVLRYGGFGAVADVPLEQAFRLYEETTEARVQFDGGPGVTTCTPYRPRPSSDRSTLGAGEPTLTVLCLLDDEPGLVSGLSGKIALNTGLAENVLRLPIGAVAGSAEFGQVALVTPDGSRTVDVELGISDGAWVEVRSGLVEGDLVLPYGPNLAQKVANN